MDESQELAYAKKSFDEFQWYYKFIFPEWDYLTCNGKDNRLTYLGKTAGKYNIDTKVIVKQIEITPEKYSMILKEEYFLACCKNNEYFVEIIDSFLSSDKKEQKNEDKKYIFLILRDEGDNLYNEMVFNRQNSDNMIKYSKFIIFRIVCGLNYLHVKNISHNDIKLENIVLSKNVKAKICDMGSTEQVSRVRYGGTDGYLSPQALLGKERTKEDDMWSVGVIFLELLLKKPHIFFKEINEDLPKKEKLKEILKMILEEHYDIKISPSSDADWNKNINYNLIINWVDKGKYNQFDSKLKSDLLKGIHDDDKEILEELLKIDPAKRISAEKFINKQIFHDLEYRLKDSPFHYSEYDYTKYFQNRRPNNFEEFKKYHEEIKEKFLGIPIIDNK